MKSCFRFFAYILCAAILLSCVPASAFAAEEITPTAFYFDCHNKTGYIGEKYGPVGTLSYTFEPYGSNEEVILVSSDPETVALEYDDTFSRWVVDYRKLGTAVITATTESGLTDSCTVTVKEMETAIIDQSFSVTVQPQDTQYYKFVPDDYGYYTFYSENGEGYLNVRARTDPFYGPGADHSELVKNEEIVLAIWNNTENVQTYTLCVKKSVPVEKILFEQESYSGYPGESIVIRPNGYPVWSIPEDYTLTSSDKGVAYFEEGSRWLNLIAPGTVTITATSESGAIGQCTVTVHEYETIKAGEQKTITLGYQESMRFVFTPETDGEYVFYMPRGDFVSLRQDENGEQGYCEDFSLYINFNYNSGLSSGNDIYAHNYVAVSCKMNAGETYVLSAINQWDAEVEITGTVHLEALTEPDSITITNESGTIFNGRAFELVCEPNGGLPFVAGDITWTVSNESIVVLDYQQADTAFGFAVGVGSTTIAATLESGVSASYEVTIVDYENYSVISTSNSYVPAGNTEPFSVTIDAPVEKFRSLWIDGNIVPNEFYTVTEGSTIITLSAQYLSELDLGWHWLEAEFVDGGAGVGITISEPHEHNYIANVIAPTCTHQGGTVYICSICEYSYTDAFVDALGHDYVDGTCSRCGEKDPDYVEPKPDEPKPTLNGVYRIAGADRIGTSLGIADQLKAVLGVEKFDAVVVASALNFPDALTGSYLAAVKNAPILLTYPAAHERITEYIADNLADHGIVYILGGESAVDKDFENMVTAKGLTVKRVAGSDRFRTNLAIMQEAGVSADQPVLIATALNFADSLSASAAGLPMVLVHGSLRPDQKDFLATTSRNFIIIGGTSAVNESLEAELRAIGTVERLAGAGRYQTSVMVAQKFAQNPDAVVLAYARNSPDGLCGGPLAYALGAPLILTDNYDPSEADKYVEGITAGIVVGGSGLISDETMSLIFDKN